MVHADELLCVKYCTVFVSVLLYTASGTRADGTEEHQTRERGNHIHIFTSA